jgi:hypothetical protein
MFGTQHSVATHGVLVWSSSDVLRPTPDVGFPIREGGKKSSLRILRSSDPCVHRIYP